MGILERLKNRLVRTRTALSDRIAGLFKGGREMDDALLGELEELLYTADLGAVAVVISFLRGNGGPSMLQSALLLAVLSIAVLLVHQQEAMFIVLMVSLVIVVDYAYAGDRRDTVRKVLFAAVAVSCSRRSSSNSTASV